MGIVKGIVVKLLSKKSAFRNCSRKSTIVCIKTKDIAQISIGNLLSTLEIGQKELETVIPTQYHSVLILEGKHKGKEAKLWEIDFKRFCAHLIVSEDWEDWVS